MSSQNITEVSESIRNSKMERLKQFYGDDDNSAVEVRKISSYWLLWSN